jgi:hypothetical protein
VPTIISLFSINAQTILGLCEMLEQHNLEIVFDRYYHFSDRLEAIILEFFQPKKI